MRPYHDFRPNGRRVREQSVRLRRCRRHRLTRRLYGRTGCMRGRAEFRRAVARLHAECEARGLTVSKDAVEDLLADAVSKAAAAMTVREETFVRSHLSTIDLGALVVAYRAAEAEGMREMTDT